MRPANYRRYIIVLRVRITCSSPSSSHFHSFFFLFLFSYVVSFPSIRLVSPSPSFIFFPLSFLLSVPPRSLPFHRRASERASEYKPSEMTTVARVPRDTLCLRVFLSTEVRSCTCAHSCTACAWKSDAEGGGGSVKRAARNTYIHTYACALLCSRHCRCHTRLSSEGASALFEPSIILHLIPRIGIWL